MLEFTLLIVLIVRFQHDSILCSAGEPGYLDFDNLPETNFSCQGKVIGGYYADVEAGCQMFHVCTIGQKDEIMDIKFLCLNGTVFDQETRVCERVDEVDCSKSERFYNLNLELYGNNAVTLSLHESNDEDASTEVIDESRESLRTTSLRPTTTGTTASTTERAIISPTTSASGAYQHPNGYPHHYQPQPRFPSVPTSQSTSLYDDKNGDYHHRYIYHTGDRRTNDLDKNGENDNDHNGNSDIGNNDGNNNKNNNNNQATSYRVFGSQGASLTTTRPQINRIRYDPTSGSRIQIRNDHQPTIAPLFHATSTTIRTLSNNNANVPALTNSIFHSHGIASTIVRFAIRNDDPRETDEYHDDTEDNGDNRNYGDRRHLEAEQPTAQDKILKSIMSPTTVRQETVPTEQRDSQANVSTDQRRITNSVSSTSNNDPRVRSFYPTPRTSTESSSSHVAQRINVPSPLSIPPPKAHRIAINFSPPDTRLIVQNPSPLLPSQSRVIVTAKASISDESGRSLNSTQLVSLPLPTIPVSYDDYKEGDESFDPFYRDVPKIRNRRANERFGLPAGELRDRGSIRGRRDSIVDKIENARMNERFDSENMKNECEEVASIGLSEEVRVNDGIEGIARSDERLLKLNDTSKGDSTRRRFALDSEERSYVRDTTEALKESDVTTVISANTETTNIVSDEGNDSTIYSRDNFERKIFTYPESQNSRDTDSRVVSQKSKSSLDRNNFIDDDKRSANDDSKDIRSVKNAMNDETSQSSLDLSDVVEPNEGGGKYMSENLGFEGRTPLEWKGVTGASEFVDSEPDRARQVSSEEYTDDKYYYDEDTESSSVRRNEEDSVECSKEASIKIDSSREKETLNDEKLSRSGGRSIEAGKKIDRNGVEKITNQSYNRYDNSEIPNVRDNEDVASFEISNEYANTEETYSVDSREIHDDENISTFRDYGRKSSETDFTDSREFTSTTQRIFSLRDSMRHEEPEGVLKFTDEIPTVEKIDESAEANEFFSSEDAPRDYIDDNYEPQSYKDNEEYSSNTENEETDILRELQRTIDMKNEKPAEEVSVIGATSMMDPTGKEENTNDEKLNDEPERAVEKNASDEDRVEKSKRPIELEEIATTSSKLRATMGATSVATTTMPATAPTTLLPPSSKITLEKLTALTTTTTTAPLTTVTSATTQSTISTSTATTMSRPTPPKLFKPFALRKSYAYVPPSTTPVPVIIKPRLTLLNPKPAKPPKSYNDYAPKPIIRKTLFARTFPPFPRITTTEVDESVVRTLSVATEAPELLSTKIATSLTTEMDENSMIEEDNAAASMKDGIESPRANQSRTFVPCPLVRMIEASSTREKALNNETEEASNEEITTTTSNVQMNNFPTVSEMAIAYLTPATSTKPKSTRSSTRRPLTAPRRENRRGEAHRIRTTSDTILLRSNVANDRPKSDTSISANARQAHIESTTEESMRSTIIAETNPTLASIRDANRKTDPIKRVASFNCLNKKMHRFYADGRDCRLFHYCSPGFNPRQFLDFRFVCEEGTTFDEESQSCIRELDNRECRERIW